MNNHVLAPYYLNELSAFRSLGKRFSKENPHLANYLQFDSGLSQNPQLAQLIESLVFMNARTSYQFEQEYPRFISSIVDVLYPHLVTPIPAMSIVQWHPEKIQDNSFVVPRGTLLETDPSLESSARFSTVYTIDVHPIEVSKAQILQGDLKYNIAQHRQSQSSIKLQIEPSNAKVSLSTIGLKELLIYLDADKETAYALYEMLLLDCQDIVLVEKNETNEKVHWMRSDDIVDIGFSLDQMALPQDERTTLGNHLLTEFFAFPEKFLFLKIKKLPEIQASTTAVEIYFNLNKQSKTISLNINKDNFKLGCTPIINLFEKTLEPLVIKQSQYEQALITDLRCPQDYEIYKIQIVTNISHGKLNKVNHVLLSDSKDLSNWHTRRISCAQLNNNNLTGTETMMTIINKNIVEADATYTISALCTNRDLPRRLLEKTVLPTLQLVNGNLPVSRIQWIDGLTLPRAPVFQEESCFLLLQSLVSNITGLCADNAQQLKKILALHVKPEQKNFSDLIENIAQLTCERASSFIHQDQLCGYCHGMKVTLHVYHRPEAGTGAWFFFNMLEKFITDMAPINNFVQFYVITQNEELYQWPIRLGEQALI